MKHYPMRTLIVFLLEFPIVITNYDNCHCPRFKFFNVLAHPLPTLSLLLPAGVLVPSHIAGPLALCISTVQVGCVM